MRFLKFLLFPIALIYELIVYFRHFLYDKGFLKSYKSTSYTICVGNLSFGGTGKTPMVEYLIRLLSSKKKIAVLSRGYKRQTKGFLLAGEKDTVFTLGDEPFQYKSKFPHILVAVDEKRARGLQQIEKKSDVIILDDAFQHRAVCPDLKILLTSYQKLYQDDFLLPVGTLRDVKSRAMTSEIVVVTKCPIDISKANMDVIKEKLKLKSHQKLYFSAIRYGDFVLSKTNKISVENLLNKPFYLVTGIASPLLLLSYLRQKKLSFEHLKYPDHHFFSKKEIENISQKSLVITTEKDFMRLGNLSENVFYLPIETIFVGNNDFDKIILEIDSDEISLTAL